MQANVACAILGLLPQAQAGKGITAPTRSATKRAVGRSYRSARVATCPSTSRAMHCPAMVSWQTTRLRPRPLSPLAKSSEQ